MMMSIVTIVAVVTALATVGNVVAAQDCRSKEDVTIVGHDYGGKIPVPSATLCCTLCAVLPACRAAVYSNGYCQRKTAGASHMSPQAGSIVLLPIPTTTTTTLAPTTPEPTPPPFPPLSRVWLNSGINGYDLGGPVYLTGNRVGYNCAGGCYTQTWVFDVDRNSTMNTSVPYNVRYVLRDGTMVYGNTVPLNVTRFDADTLQPLWVSEYSDLSTATFFSAVNDVMITNGCPNPDTCSTTVVFNNTNGAVMWSLGSTVLMCANDAIVVTTSTSYPEYPNNTATAWDILSGTLLFTFNSPLVNNGYPNGHQNSKASENLVFFTSTNNKVAVLSAINGSYIDVVEGADASIGFAREDDANGFFAIGWANCSAISWEGKVLWTAPGNSMLTLDKANPHVVYGLASGNLTAYHRRSGHILAQSAVNGKRYSWTQALGVENGVVLTGQSNSQSFGPTVFSLYRVSQDGGTFDSTS